MHVHAPLFRQRDNVLNLRAQVTEVASFRRVSPVIARIALFIYTRSPSVP